MAAAQSRVYSRGRFEKWVSTPIRLKFKYAGALREAINHVGRKESILVPIIPLVINSA